MNWVDVVSLATWGAVALWGMNAGLLKAFVLLIFLLAAIGFANGLGDQAGAWAFFFIESEARQGLAGFFLVFAAVLAVGAMVTFALGLPLSIVSTLVSMIPAGGLVNRIGGMAVGALIGLTLLSVILIGLQQYPVPAVGKAITESSIASAPMGWVDRYVDP